MESLADFAIQAQLSEPLAALFPPGVVATEVHQPLVPGARELLAEQSRLTSEEWACIMHCHERRIEDFAVGRLCAHRALENLGISPTSLLPGRDREPLWPLGVTGSITHTEGYSAAVVGPSSVFAGLGVDSERIDEVQPGLWRGICAPQELHALLSSAPQERRWLAALTFVAKEAFYKCQYPLTRERLPFDAVRVQLASGCAHARAGVAQEFWIEPLRTLQLQTVCPSNLGASASANAPSARWMGRFRCHQGYLSAGIALPAQIQ